MLPACFHSNTWRDPSREICTAAPPHREISRPQDRPRIYLNFKKKIEKLIEKTNVIERYRQEYSFYWNVLLVVNIQCLRNRKHVPCFYRVIQTRVEVWENEKCCGNTSRRRVFPQPFRVLPNFHECLYNSIETRSTCFLFLLENTTTRKRKTTC